MNDHIKTALDNVDAVRAVYKKVAKQEKPNNWYPFQVICPKCGKVGSTLVDGWNGEEVTFTCMPTMVTWAKGCGYQGSISPFNGTGKLMWKVDWPAHWKAIGVTIEGAGKDHSSDGGSRDIATALLTDVFNYPNPFDIPYEWFLIGGQKMSSSKGVGTTAREFAQIIPPVIGRFLFVRTKFSRQLNFDPSGDTIPDLFDEYDRMAKAYWSDSTSDYARIFELSQIGDIPTPHFLPRFRDIARIIQDPKSDLMAEMARQKGEDLTKEDIKEISERIEYVGIWLKTYASKEDVVELIDHPQVSLSALQKTYLEGVNGLLKTNPTDPELFQQQLYQLTKNIPIPAKEAFAAIYQTMIGKTHGPKAAWLLIEHKDHALKTLAWLLDRGENQ
jgi:lysyl-tRNA synthetase class 1